MVDPKAGSPLDSADTGHGRFQPATGSRLAIAGILAIAMISGWLRFGIALQEPLWLDELHTGWVVNDSITEVLLRTAESNQSPLFFLINWVLHQLAPDSAIVLRGVSLVSGLLLITLGSGWVFRLTGSVAGSWLTAVLLAGSDLFLFYGTEARPYALLQLLSLGHVWLLWRWVNRNSVIPATGSGAPFWQACISGLPLLCMTLALIYTHFIAIVLLVAEAVWLLLTMIRIDAYRRKKRYGPLIGSLLLGVSLVVIAVIPLCGSMQLSLSRRSLWSSVSSIDQLARELGPIVFGSVLIPGLAWLCYRGFHRFSGMPAENRAAAQPVHFGGLLLLLVLWCNVPIGLLIVLDATGIAPLALSRYAASALVAAPLFAGLIAGAAGGKANRILAAGVTVAALSPFWLGQQTVAVSLGQRRLPVLRYENWPEVISAINRDEQKSTQPVFLFGGVLEDEMAFELKDHRFQEYLQFPLRSIYRLRPTGRVVFAGPTLAYQHFDDRYLDDTLDHGGAWLLIRHRASMVAEITSEFCQKLDDRMDRDSLPYEITTRSLSGPDSDLVLVSVDIRTR